MLPRQAGSHICKDVQLAVNPHSDHGPEHVLCIGNPIDKLLGRPAGCQNGLGPLDILVVEEHEDRETFHPFTYGLITFLKGEVFPLESAPASSLVRETPRDYGYNLRGASSHTALAKYNTPSEVRCIYIGLKGSARDPGSRCRFPVRNYKNTFLQRCCA